MAVSDVRPYLVPAVDTVQPSTWFRSVDGEWEPLGDAIENWDYRSELRLRCTIEVDPAVVRAQSMLTMGRPWPSTSGGERWTRIWSGLRCVCRCQRTTSR